MTAAGLVLDTDAMLAYARGSLVVGAAIAKTTATARHVLVPVLCLAEAYRRATSEEWDYLELLWTVPGVEVSRVEPGDAQFLGGHARTLGSKHLAHAVIEAAAHPVTPIMTSQRERVTQVLAKEWPIIDL
jgi:hypothetical protein